MGLAPSSVRRDMPAWRHGHWRDATSVVRGAGYAAAILSAAASASSSSSPRSACAVARMPVRNAGRKLMQHLGDLQLLRRGKGLVGCRLARPTAACARSVPNSSGLDRKPLPCETGHHTPRQAASRKPTVAVIRRDLAAMCAAGSASGCHRAYTPAARPTSPPYHRVVPAIWRDSSPSASRRLEYRHHRANGSSANHRARRKSRPYEEPGRAVAGPTAPAQSRGAT
jgi:hypothetical protein